jgi:hypothetical protein
MDRQPRLLHYVLAFLLHPVFLSAQVPEDLVFVQIPASGFSSPTETNEYLPLNTYLEGTRIVLLQKNAGQPMNLTGEFAAACDPDISFDGNTIIFSGQKFPGDLWQIWRMSYDGSQKVRITDEKGDCYAPVHAGNRFYLDDPQPTPQIIFVGNAHSRAAGPEGGTAASLYATDAEGKTVRRLTFSLDGVFSPDVLPNGRIVFPSLQRGGLDGVLALMAINNDGTDLMSFYGNHEPPYFKRMVHVSTSDDRVYFIESDNPHALSGGDISFVSRRRPLHSYTNLHHEKGGTFLSPSVLPGFGLVASFRSEKKNSVFSIYAIDAESGRRKKEIFAETGWHSVDTQTLSPSSPVKGRSNWLIPGAQTGVFYCLNSYITNLNDGEEIRPGSIRYVRVIEGLSQKADSYESGLDSRGVNGDYRQGTFTPQRILGVAPVEKDGSFHIRVPAEIPITFQLLDDDQMSLRSQQSWSWVMGNENRGCIGCHEDPELSPPNRLVQAVKKPPVELLLPPDQRKTVDFRHQIAPIIESTCAKAGCHIAGQTPSGLILLGQENNFEVYRSLTETKERGRYVIAGRARTSPLINHLMGENPVHRNLLSPEERLLFVEWIDLGAQWDIASHTAVDSR